MGEGVSELVSVRVGELRRDGEGGGRLHLEEAQEVGVRLLHLLEPLRETCLDKSDGVRERGCM